MDESLNSIETGTPLGIVIREARAYGLRITSKQVRDARAPDKSIALVNMWIEGARCLEEYLPAMYARFLRAFISGQPLPPLPSPSRLAQIPSHALGLHGEQRTLAIHPLLTTPEIKSRRDKIVSIRYPAHPAGKKALVRVDKRIDGERSAPADLLELIERAREGLVPIADARARLERLRALLLETAEMTELLADDLASL